MVTSLSWINRKTAWVGNETLFDKEIDLKNSQPSTWNTTNDMRWEKVGFRKGRWKWDAKRINVMGRIGNYRDKVERAMWFVLKAVCPIIERFYTALRLSQQLSISLKQKTDGSTVFGPRETHAIGQRFRKAAIGTNAAGTVFCHYSHDAS